MSKKLPVGIEDFEKLRKEDFYYIDKTGLIEDLLNNWAEVNLFTRPRRFGKTLNMSMLQNFFEIGTDKSVFDGLKISGNRVLCDIHMGRYPVIFISLKGIDGLSFKEAENMLKKLIQTESGRHKELSDSTEISEPQKRELDLLVRGESENLTDSLRLLSEMLCRHYGKKVVLLIDEYDVPLDKAFVHGYYREMVSLMRGFLGQALKTNKYLQFAVLTGCLRISKESIFTGLNNFKVLSIVDARFSEHFGFTDEEVRKILTDYDLLDHYDEVKEWYDGYHFADADIYCPWDVINHVDLLRANSKAKPQAYWINTSGNDLVKRFVDIADKSTRDEIEKLVSGESIEKTIRPELTYDEIDLNIENLWSVLFTTGYLTQASEASGQFNHTYSLMIPNKEVREVFVYQIQEWFKEKLRQDDTPLKELSSALECGDAESVTGQLTAILTKSISILDTKARESQKENFYHGLLIGLLRSESEWLVRSNVEAGDGFCDIMIEPEDPDAGIIIEVKYASTFAGLEKACETALAQIRDRRYGEYFKNEGRENILAYGIAFHKKRCRAVVERLN